MYFLIFFLYPHWCNEYGVKVMELLRFLLCLSELWSGGIRGCLGLKSQKFFVYGQV